jgi:hypothetical protein
MSCSLLAFDNQLKVNLARDPEYYLTSMMGISSGTKLGRYEICSQLGAAPTGEPPEAPPANTAPKAVKEKAGLVGGLGLFWFC